MVYEQDWAKNYKCSICLQRQLLVTSRLEAIASRLEAIAARNKVERKGRKVYYR